MLQQRMIARPVADRHLPRDRAGVEVVRGHPAVRRLVQRKPIERRQLLRRRSILKVAPRRIAFRQRHDDRAGERGNEEHPAHRIDARAAPVGAADVTRHLHGAALGWRREQRAAIPLLQHLERLRAQLRREVDHIIVEHALAIEGRRLGRKRLRCRRALARRASTAARAAPRSARRALRFVDRTRRRTPAC